jgi:Zn finger protein HypA/HybF involved in hydrogenase expression
LAKLVAFCLMCYYKWPLTKTDKRCPVCKSDRIIFDVKAIGKRRWGGEHEHDTPLP